MQYRLLADVRALTGSHVHTCAHAGIYLFACFSSAIPYSLARISNTISLSFGYDQLFECHVDKINIFNHINQMAESEICVDASNEFVNVIIHDETCN